MTGKVGVFLCKCSDNIASKVDIEQLTVQLQNETDVAFVETHELLCSGGGQAFFEKQMAQSDVSHVVISACSPKDHESTFQKCMSKAGKNKFLMQMANIREQCTWVTEENVDAFNKSKALTLAAIKRVQLHDALTEKEIECNTEVVVIGGGIAGIEAALLAAGDGRKVTILEQSPSLGGMVTKIEDAAPSMECAPCMVSPRISQIEESDNIDIVTNCDITEIAGYLGNFEISVLQRARMVDADACIGCDECIQVCPVDVSSEYDYGLGSRKAIDVLFPGCFPNCAVVDTVACLKTQGKECNACVEACPMDAMDFTQKDTTMLLRCGAVILATGAKQFDAGKLAHLGLDRLTDVYSYEQFARLTSNHGPTGGQVLKQNGEFPKRIAFVHCVGRKELGYCSGGCCQGALGLGIAARNEENAPEIVHLVSDVMCAGELGQSLIVKAHAAQPHNDVKDLQHIFSDVPNAMGDNALRISNPPLLQRVDDISRVVIESLNDYLGIQFSSLGKNRFIPVDMVVLVTGTQPSQSSMQLMEKLDIAKTVAGFAAPDHVILRPSSSSLDGVFLAGAVSGRTTISSTISSAKAAAGVTLSKLVPGKKLQLKAIVANAKSELCSACGLCVAVCPYAAVRIDLNRAVASINEVLCQGCGTCVATCPSGAAAARHFTDAQLDAEVKEVLDG